MSPHGVNGPYAPDDHAAQPYSGSAPGYPVVLYFHHITGAINNHTAITKRAFAEVLDIVLSEMEPCDPRSISGDLKDLPSRPSVLVTFDDGYLDVWQNALDVLEQRQMRALFFVVTGSIGSSFGDGPSARCMTWNHCRELVARGHAVGSHGVTHHHMTKYSARSARSLVTESLTMIEDQVQVPVRALAYPYGHIPTESICPEGVLGFGTARLPARPWATSPHEIRRTFVPAGLDERAWAPLVRRWKLQWYGPASPAPAIAADPGGTGRTRSRKADAELQPAPSVLTMWNMTDGVALWNAETGVSVELDRVGSEVWLQLKQGFGIADVTHAVARIFEVRAKTLSRDLIPLLEGLKDRGFLIDSAVANPSRCQATPVGRQGRSGRDGPPLAAPDEESCTLSPLERQ